MFSGGFGGFNFGFGNNRDDGNKINQNILQIKTNQTIAKAPR